MIASNKRALEQRHTSERLAQHQAHQQELADLCAAHELKLDELRDRLASRHTELAALARVETTRMLPARGDHRAAALALEGGPAPARFVAPSNASHVVLYAQATRDLRIEGFLLREDPCAWRCESVLIDDEEQILSYAPVPLELACRSIVGRRVQAPKKIRMRLVADHGGIMPFVTLIVALCLGTTEAGTR